MACGSSQARVQSELQLRTTAMPDMNCVCNLHHSSGNTRSLTHWAGPGIKPTSSWILVGFITTEPQWELPHSPSFNQTVGNFSKKKIPVLFSLTLQK